MENSKAEVLRYLGWRGQEMSDALDAIIEKNMVLIRETAAIRYVTHEFDICAKTDGIHLTGRKLVLKGEDIASHLSGCRKAVLLAATLGIGADNLIRKYTSIDLTQALIIEACASQLIEEVCDRVEARIRSAAAEIGLTVTRRYSPGYGDFPLTTQPELLAALDAERKIGLTCSESLILIPRKSVTAVIGIGHEIELCKSGCEVCASADGCKYRKRGNNCGDNRDNER